MGGEPRSAAGADGAEPRSDAGADGSAGPEDANPGVDRRDAILAGAGAVLVGLGAGAVVWRETTGRWPGTAPPREPGPTATTGRTLASDRLAPGVSEDGVVEPAVLADAHAETLEPLSYELASERRVRRPDGTLLSSLRVTVALAADRSFLARLETDGPAAPLVLGTPPARATFWSDGERYLRRFTRGNRTTYNTFEPPGEYVGSWRYWVRTVPFGGGYGGPEQFYGSVFGDVPTRIAGRRIEGGRSVWEVADETAAPRTGTPGFALDVDDVAAVSLAAMVDERGVVPSLHLDHDGTVTAGVWTADATETGAAGTPTRETVPEGNATGAPPTGATATETVAGPSDTVAVPGDTAAGPSDTVAEPADTAATATRTSDAPEPGRPVAVEWTVHYRSVGATAVERPPWYDRAVEE